MSFFWSNTSWGQSNWYTAETVDRMVDEFHVELVRAAMGVEESGGFFSDSRNQERVETVVEAAIDRNIYRRRPSLRAGHRLAWRPARRGPTGDRPRRPDGPGPARR